MTVPFKRSISHTKVHLGLLLSIPISGLLRDLHSSIEMLGTGIIVSLLGENLSQLHVGTRLSLSVFELVGQFEVTLNEHLHLILVHLSVDIISSDFTEISNGDTLTGHTAHLDGVSESELMVDRTLLVVSYIVIDYTQVDMGQELTCHISNFLVLHVVLDSILVVGGINFTKLHEINTDTVVSESFSVNISDGSTNLEELLVLSNSFLKFTKVVK